MAADQARVLRVTRRFDASPQRVFDAWLDPKLAGRWLFTSPTSETHTTQIDARIGGAWSITDRRDGVDYRAIGEYLQIDPPRRIVFTFAMPQFSDAFDTVTVDLAPDGAGCILTLTQVGVAPEDQAATLAGWDGMFDMLAVVAA
ncbi:MAG: SRPBCC domain-containing protein [Caulobacterales bacterium]